MEHNRMGVSDQMQCHFEVAYVPYEEMDELQRTRYNQAFKTLVDLILEDEKDQGEAQDAEASPERASE